MALSRPKKEEVIKEIKELLTGSKLTVIAKYEGTTVDAMQQLRRQARDNGSLVRVIKNRLLIQALGELDQFKSADSSQLRGQLLYAFNDADEVAPAQLLANFSRAEPQIAFVGALSADGSFINSDDVKHLASLPSKDQLRGMLIGTINAPLTGFVNVVAGNVRGLLNVINARAEQLS